MTLGYLDLFYAKVKVGHFGFCMGKGANYYYYYCYFFENCCSLRSLIDYGIQLNELMKLNEYQRSRSFFHMKANGNENLYK